MPGNDLLSSNTNRFSQSSTRSAFSSEGEINELRARIFGKTNEPKEPPITKKPTNNDEFELKKPTNNDKVNVAVKSTCTHFRRECFSFIYLDNGTILYTGITVAVALVVFVAYMVLT